MQMQTQPQPKPLAATKSAGVPRSYESVYADEEADPSDDERTHMSVLSRRLRKRRKTNSSLVSNPFGLMPHTPSEQNLDDFDDDEFDKNSDGFRRRRAAAVPESDVHARERCFEYLHTAIDALWAEYCDSTAYAESLKYMPHSPVSEHEEPVFLSSGDERSIVSKFVDVSEGQVSPKSGHQRSASISMQPQSQSLMRQKKRLVDAKYYLTHFVGAHDPQSSSVFWRVWDQLKYTAVELVEGDDDEAGEVIQDLELGRAYYQ